MNISCHPILAAALGILALLPPLSASTVDFPLYGFQIDALDGKPVASSTSALMTFLPPVEGFAPNINVQIQSYAGSIKDYAALSGKQFEQMKWTVVEEKLTGESEWMVEYKGPMQDRNLHFYARAVLKDGKVYLTTATALESQWTTTGPTLRQHVNSFKTK